jgi:nucleotide-binding universal stress UspA family protein
MLDPTSTPTRRRRSAQPPFPRILCAVEGTDATETAIEQAISVAGGDARIVFAGSWYGGGSAKRGLACEEEAHRSVRAAVSKAREAGVDASCQVIHAPRLSDGLLQSRAQHDLVVVGAPPHARTTGIVLGETATRLVHRSPVPVLLARPRALETGVVVGTRALPDDRRAMTTAAHLAARLGAELTVVHVAKRDQEHERPELHAELANARALLGRSLDYVPESGSPARALVAVAEGDGAGLIVVGSRNRLGLPALTSVSERVAHLAPCSVLVMRERRG